MGMCSGAEDFAKFVFPVLAAVLGLVEDLEAEDVVFELIAQLPELDFLSDRGEVLG